MKESKVDLVLHPIRMRIIQCLIGGRKLTVQQISNLLPDIPQATLYRHINKLAEADILILVEEKKVRGTIEKTYGLPEKAGNMAPDELNALNIESHMRYFMAFLTTLMDDFERYLQQDKFNLIDDGVSYRKATVYLSDEEFRELFSTIGTAIMKAVSNPPTPERRRRNISTIVVPEPNE